MIATAPSINFDLTPAAEQQMMQAGVSEDTIKAMSARESGLTQQTSLAPAIESPIASVPVETANRAHKVRRNWIIVGVVAVVAGGAAYAGYRLSNPHHCAMAVYGQPNPTCN